MPGMWRLTLISALAACETPPERLTLILDRDGRREAVLDVEGARTIILDTQGDSVLVEVNVEGDGVGVEAFADGVTYAAPHWQRPVPVVSSVPIHLTGHGAATVTVWSRGHVLDPVDPERALVWHEPTPLDDPSVISFATIMASIAPDGHGGVLLESWFDRFATTPHSQRPAPGRLVSQLRAAQGPDPTQWDLRALPFRITAVHNRLDLWSTQGSCGQVRVTAAAATSETNILHVIFLFRQLTSVDDRAPDGRVHCLGTARRWSRLSSLSEAEFADAARVWLRDALTLERFALAESLELDGHVWEWRQWEPRPSVAPGLPFVLENPSLFQTVDVAQVNAAGPLRDDFVAFVEANADALNERKVVIPERFRSKVARQRELQPREPIDLAGVDPAILAQFPQLGEQIEIVGCVACHTEPAAEFNHTYPGRFFSDFHFHEVEARAALLDDMNAGRDVPPPAFGPLQLMH